MYACVGSDFRGDKGGILRSSDLGDTWERFDHGHSVDSTTFGLSVNPQDSGQVYFCTRRGQVFGTDDGGTTWHGPIPCRATSLIPFQCWQHPPARAVGWG